MRPKFASPKVFLWIIHFRHSLLWGYNWYLRKFYGMKLAPDVRVSLKARIDKTNPQAIEVGPETLIAFDAIILSHDFSTGRHSGDDAPGIRIGSRCFIGCASIIMPGVTIGDQCIVASGSVVTKDVPAHSIVAGNPAKVIRSGINTEPFGILIQDNKAEAGTTPTERLHPKMAETV
ncbi:MAG: Hexapeptide repeat of succinyl-transferase [uncultured Thiotrichaceae bacterium]|uniref:Hexapeptide repeat of succinyl-transferase n=1 Tax=uncultured Thiotrichaceae bacterium TaxID=298394 RepID=A0A6S6TX41_9GAMM|nr:MAG: Hexapeptide repeat of succinyl-transferase [uncultured Thiotrichaceae bacterium]